MKTDLFAPKLRDHRDMSKMAEDRWNWETSRFLRSFGIAFQLPT
jgi:hypothetical protein